MKSINRFEFLNRVFQNANASINFHFFIKFWSWLNSRYKWLFKQLRAGFCTFSRIVLSPFNNLGEIREKLGEDWRPIERMMVGSVIIIMTFFGGFGGWAAVAPLESAVVAPGQIMVSSHRKSINHKEGGIVKDIFVKDGDRVAGGDVLVQLDDTQAKVELRRLTVRKFDLLATQSRLLSEQKKAPSIFLTGISQRQKNDPVFFQSIQAQRNIFHSRRKNLRGRTDILGQVIAQLEIEIEGYKSQLLSLKERNRLLGIELKALSKLFKRKLIGNQRLLELRGDIAEIAGIEGELKAKIAATKTTIVETELKIVDHQNIFKSEVAAELAEVKSQLADIMEQIVAASDVLIRTSIVAPMDGVIVNLRVHTIDSSIDPSEVVLDLLPENDELMVQARINPLDIDVVRKDLLSGFT